MGTGPSIFLVAVGAILRFALETSVDGINLGTVGVILMAVGALGLLISLMLRSRFRPASRGSDIGSGRVPRDTESVSSREPENV